MPGAFSRQPGVLLKSVLTISGAALLILMFARWGPWRMLYILLNPLQPGFVEFRFPFYGSINISYYLFIGLCCTLLPAAAFLFQAVRDSAAHLCKNNSKCWHFVLSLLFFLCTFFSGFFLEEKNTWPEMPVRSVALYLTLGLYGVCFLFMGMSCTVYDLGLWTRLRSFILTAKLFWFLAALFLIEFLATNLISYFAFEHIPHIQDSVAQLFHGMIFARGHLTAPSPPLPELFYYMHIINNGQWYSQYPPGHTILLMLGVLADAPWIVNPLLGSATVVLLYFLGRELYSDAIGRLSAILGLFSPFILFMSSEFMNHVTGLFLFTVFILFYARALRLKSILPALIAGAALGWIVNIRPLSAISLALPFIAYACLLLAKRFRQYGLPFLAMSCAALFFVAILLVFNWLTNGDPLLFGYQVLYGNEHLPGFGRAAWGEAHTLAKGMEHTLNNFVGLNKYLFEWPIPSLFFVFILFASGRAGRWDALLLCSFLCLALGYLAYWYQDWCFGPRFLYEASGAVIVLSARGIQVLPSLIRDVFGQRQVSVGRIRGFAAAVIFFCATYGLITNVSALYRGYSKSYWCVDRKLEKKIQEKNLPKVLVFIRHIGFRPLMLNSPFLDSGIIYVLDSEKLRNKVIALFPGNRYFLEQENTMEEIFPE